MPMAADQNPYAAPAPPVEEIATGEGAPPDVEAIRHAHIKREASIRAIGLLYCMGAGFYSLNLVIGPAVLFVVLTHSEMPAPGPFEAIGIGAAYLFVVAVVTGAFLIGYGLRRLLPAVLTPVRLVSILLIPFLPIGTLIGIYTLVVVFDKQGQYVFSPEYRQVIAATPHVQQQTHWLARLLLCFALAVATVLLLAFVAAVIVLWGTAQKPF